jgi:hypothetical protein
MKPTFLRQLADPRIETVLLAGCGGGFDFVHGMLLWGELGRLGKRVLVHSYSFGDPGRIRGSGRVVFDEGDAIVKLVDRNHDGHAAYAPEIHLCSYLDERDPDRGLHQVYASYSRAFTPDRLRRFYSQLVAEHAIDAIVLFDGGSDALMVGDEAGLGDPIEDAVSVQAVAAVPDVPLKLLLTVGLGVDRFNGVSDASSLRAVAELTKAGGFRGALAVEPSSPEFLFYRDAIDHIEERQTIRSMVARSIRLSVMGHHGGQVPESLYCWSPMAWIWGFDVETVARRSLLGAALRDAATVGDCYRVLLEFRRARETRSVEHLPPAEPWPFDSE